MATRRKKIRVVVAEDHKPLRELTKEVLSNTGHFEVVGEASNGEEVVKVAQATKPDLVLLDLKMPGTDGFKALPELVRVSPPPKVVAYSMLQRDIHEPRARELGAVSYIEKSVDSGELIGRLLSLFGLDGDGATGGGGPPGKRKARGFGASMFLRLPTFGPRRAGAV